MTRINIQTKTSQAQNFTFFTPASWGYNISHKYTKTEVVWTNTLDQTTKTLKLNFYRDKKKQFAT